MDQNYCQKRTKKTFQKSIYYCCLYQTGENKIKNMEIKETDQIKVTDLYITLNTCFQRIIFTKMDLYR